VALIPAKFDLIDSYPDSTYSQVVEDAIPLFEKIFDRLRQEVTKTEEIWDVQLIDIPKQTDCDCGVYVIMYINSDSGDFPVDLGPDDMPFFRQKIALSILAADLVVPLHLTPRGLPELEDISLSVANSTKR
jgi:Ulp1 family protease